MELIIGMVVLFLVGCRITALMSPRLEFDADEFEPGDERFQRIMDRILFGRIRFILVKGLTPMTMDQMRDDKWRHAVLDCFASLCDSQKRLERAIKSKDADSVDYYLGEAEKRRHQVEQKILGLSGPPQNDVKERLDRRGIAIADLTQDDIGRQVRYNGGPSQTPDVGDITSFNDTYVFVKYTGESQAKATLPQSLEFTYYPEEGDHHG